MSYIKVQDIKVNELYLAKRYINSKKIIFQPVIIESLTNIIQVVGFDKLVIKYLDGQEGTIYINNGECKDSAGQITLKPIGNFITQELKKLESEQKCIEDKINQLKKYI